MTGEDTPPKIDDDLLDRVLIGGRESRPIVIVDYDPDWPQRFAQERARILEALGTRAQLVEHIGSTSVPGLAAKPIIDILVTVDAAEIDDDQRLVTDLAAVGYVLRVREPDHRMFRTPERDVHIHVFPKGSGEIERHLLLRDRLRRSDEDRELYAATKRELAQREWSDMNYYAEAKTDVIQAILRRAREDRERGIG
ncbi:MAG TPA: GrpB family protein [Nitrolancea sp.]|nr:GrpB family protein [Nitrolancea sp.]